MKVATLIHPCLRFVGLATLALLSVIEAYPQNLTVLQKVAVFPDLILYNGKIATMDPNMTFHQAMAVRGERIWRLGRDAEIRPLAGPQTVVVDLQGRTVVPGLIDAHTHPHLWALPHLGGKYDAQLAPLYVEGRNVEEVRLKMGPEIQRRIQQAGADKWILLSVPWNMDGILGPSGITRAELDRIAPQTPVFAMAGYFSSVSNTKASDLMKNAFGKDLDGLRGLYMIPYDIILDKKLDSIANMLVEEMEENLTFGITTFASHIEPINVYRALTKLHQAGQMPARWGWVHRTGFTLAKDPVEFYRLMGDFDGAGDNWLWNFGVGQESWGGSCTAAIPKDEKAREQLRRANVRGCNYVPGAVGYEAHKAAVEGGHRLAIVHAIRDGELDGAIRLADQVTREGTLTLEQVKNPGWSLDHGHLVRPDQVPLAAKYGFWMSFQATQVASAVDSIPAQFGEEFVPWISPANSWLKAGARLIFSSDAHIGKLDPMAAKMLDESLIHNWPYHDSVWPWVGFWVTRELNGKVWSPQERVDRVTALRGWTNWAADDLLRGKELGTLEPGKLADFAVIDKDYFTIPERDLLTINTLMTGLNGKIVYRAPNF